MHKPNTRNTRKKILILAAVSLIAVPSLGLPGVSAQQASPAANSRAADPSASVPVQVTPPAASPQADPSAAAEEPTSQEADSAAPQAPVESAAEETPAVTPSAASGQTPAPTAPAAPSPTKPAAGTPAPTAPAAPEPFFDIVKDPNRDAIMTLYNEGIVKASKDRKFRPKAEIGRSDFSVILGRAMKANGSIFDVYFTDPIPDWAIRYVGGLTAAGIYEGYLDGDQFGPKLPVTRAEAAAMVARAAHLESQPLPEGLGGVSNIPVWALDDVGAAYAAGLIEVTNTGTLNPNKKVTRSEMAAMIAPLLEADAFMTPIKIEEDITLPDRANTLAGKAVGRLIRP